MIFMSEFNPSVMNGNLSRLILEQYVDSAIRCGTGVVIEL